MAACVDRDRDSNKNVLEKSELSVTTLKLHQRCLIKRLGPNIIERSKNCASHLKWKLHQRCIWRCWCKYFIKYLHNTKQIKIVLALKLGYGLTDLWLYTSTKLEIVKLLAVLTHAQKTILTKIYFNYQLTIYWTF